MRIAQSLTLANGLVLASILGAQTQQTRPPTTPNTRPNTNPPPVATPSSIARPASPPAIAMPPTITRPGSPPPIAMPPTMNPRAPTTSTTVAPATSTMNGLSNLPPIFRFNDLSRALTLNGGQVDQLNAMTQRLQNQFQPQFDRVNWLPADQQLAQQMVLNREFANAWLAGASKFMTSSQLSRYQQLQLQLGGFASFNDPAIQRGLNLSDRQIGQLNDALVNSNTQLQTILQQSQTNPGGARQAYADYEQAYETRLDSILTLQQQRLWSQMTGEPFPFPPLLGTGESPIPRQ